MKLQILGSGGSIPTPRIGSQSEASVLARKHGIPYKRNCSCMYFWDADALFDCPEDISTSLNDHGILSIKNIFITHRHPDHSFGLRLLLGSVFDPVEKKVSYKFNLYMPERVYSDLKKYYPGITYYVETLGLADVIFLEHEEHVSINGYEISTIGYEGKDSRVNGYMISGAGKKALYTPCETILYKYFGLSGLDVLITECGIFSYEKVDSEISFPDMIKNIQQLAPKKTYITHIEEIELAKRGLSYLEKMKQTYAEVDFEFCTDGLEIYL